MSVTISGHTDPASNGSSSSFTINPSVGVVGNAVATGDWIIAVLSSPSDTAGTRQPTAPGDWTSIATFARVGTGSMSFGVWAHLRTGGETTYTWSQTTAETQSTYTRLIFVSGADDIANWVIGSFANRASNATTTTAVAPAVTTTSSNSLALLLAGERTIATETDGQVTCDNFTKQWFENSIDHTLFVASKDMPSAGSTGDVTVTYPNTHAQNGIAGIIGIAPPVVAPVNLMWVQGINT